LKVVAVAAWRLMPLKPSKNESHIKMNNPILLVNAFYDPETSYAWVVNLQRDFGDDNAVLLSRNDSGH